MTTRHSRNHGSLGVNPRRVVAVAALLFATRAAGAQTQTATLAIVNGHVVTVDSTRPEAEAVAMAGDRILAVGTNAEVRRLATPRTRVIDAAGRLVIPGLIDGHGHYMALGESKLQLDLTTARTWDEIVARVADAARKAPRGAWIEGYGWHQEKWDHPPTPAVEGNPVHASLSAVSPNNPVVLSHASGHATFVNAAMLRLAGITNATPNPAGGEILRDASGAATGLLRESAQDLTDRARTRTVRDGNRYRGGAGHSGPAEGRG